MNRTVLVLGLLSGCFSTPPNTPTENFELLWADFDAHYGLFPVKENIDWDTQYDTYRPQVSDSTTPEELADIFKAMLSPLNDSHVYLGTWMDESFWSSYEAGREPDDFDLDVIRDHYLTDLDTIQDEITWGHLAADVGYLRMHNFRFSGAQDKVAEALDTLNDTSTLVIDIRNNPGGNDKVSADIAGCFADEVTPFMEVRIRNGPEHTDFADPIFWDVVPSESCRYDGEVLLLTNIFVFSSAEVFTMAMVGLPGVTHIGEHTAGSFSDKVKRELPNGWVYGLSIGDWRDADGVNHEGFGIVPTVERVNPVAAVEEGRDEVLDLALELASE
ncbi:MAG: carboxyl-terminal processing protease [Myxococcota bacterium]|jgi:carboxyl-terminal processing protease